MTASKVMLADRSLAALHDVTLASSLCRAFDAAWYEVVLPLHTSQKWDCCCIAFLMLQYSQARHNPNH